jgi:hypothetical protein
MNAASQDTTASVEVLDSQDKPWSAIRWVIAIAIVFGLHIGLFYALGSRKPIELRPVKSAPELTMASSPSEFQQLDDPTLFALPHPRGFASATWLRVPQIAFIPFRWTEPPRLLALPAQQLGETFLHFANTNINPRFEVQSLPAVQFTTVEPVETFDTSPRESRLRVAGDLAGRRMMNEPVALRSWPSADLLTNTLVSVFVDARGNVFSPVVQRPGSGSKSADQLAHKLASEAKFNKAQGQRDTLTKGLLIFEWQTLPKTNAPAATP